MPVETRGEEGPGEEGKEIQLDWWEAIEVQSIRTSTLRDAVSSGHSAHVPRSIDVLL